LDAHDRAGGFMQSPDRNLDGTQLYQDIGEGPGTQIGRYKLLQEIGQGGFGVVYMAEQVEPVRRRVALKIIKLGMDTKQVIGRFEAERQALAMMDHPNIARILDGGTTGQVRNVECGVRNEEEPSDTPHSALGTPHSEGRPYFVMELVRGVPITEFCDENRLTTEERLALFMDVCHAVQHAHQKGVIHRDIKPSNVLVTLHDDRPVPKVIDFGIAKATQHRLTERTIFTEFKQFIGTPMYMSPEQAALSGLDIDTRTDVYSLGVLLYELLTGTTPFDKNRLLEASYDEIRRSAQAPQLSPRLAASTHGN
jgi:serine/threonine protein kinase